MKAAPIGQLREIRKLLRNGLGVESSPHLALDNLIKNYETKTLNFSEVSEKWEKLVPAVVSSLRSFCADSVVEKTVPVLLTEKTSYIIAGDTAFTITVEATARDTAKVFNGIIAAFTKPDAEAVTESTELGVIDPKPKSGKKAMKVV